MVSTPLSRSSLVTRCLFSFEGGIFFMDIMYYVLSSKIRQEFFLPVILQFFLLAHRPSLYQPLYYLRRMFPIYDFLSNKKRSSHAYTLLYDISNKICICKSDWFSQPSCKGKKHPNFHPLDLRNPYVQQIIGYCKLGNHSSAKLCPLGLRKPAYSRVIHKAKRLRVRMASFDISNT